MVLLVVACSHTIEEDKDPTVYYDPVKGISVLIWCAGSGGAEDHNDCSIEIFRPGPE